MKRLRLLSLCLCPLFVYAAPACNGDYVQGTIETTPTFNDGTFLSGGGFNNIELSHTHITVNSNGTDYDVAIDNVFASDYDQSGGSSIPQSYSSALQVGQTIELCGTDYTGGQTGIHWVHTNCGVSSSGPAGYAIVNGVDLTSNTEYCPLWPTS